MIRLSVAGFFAGVFLAVPALGPTAAADPQDLEPYCTAGQVPTTGQCKPLPGDVYTDNAPGADPQLPMGLDPGSVPAV